MGKCDIDIEEEVHEVPDDELYMDTNYIACKKHMGNVEGMETLAEWKAYWQSKEGVKKGIEWATFVKTRPSIKHVENWLEDNARC